MVGANLLVNFMNLLLVIVITVFPLKKKKSIKYYEVRWYRGANPSLQHSAFLCLKEVVWIELFGLS